MHCSKKGLYSITATARPSTIFDLPFLREQAKRNILGENARRLFKLEPLISEAKIAARAARAAAQ